MAKYSCEDCGNDLGPIGAVVRFCDYCRGVRDGREDAAKLCDSHMGWHSTGRSLNHFAATAIGLLAEEIRALKVKP